jgi:hypothetical protein
MANLIVYLESHLLCAHISVHSEVGFLWQRAAKWQKMNLQGRAWQGTVRFRRRIRTPKSMFIPKPSGKYRWRGIIYDILSEDALRGLAL